MPKGIAAKEYNIRIEDDQLYRVFNEAYLPYLNEVKRYEVYYGGAGSGKCFGAGTKVVMFDGTLKAVEDVRVGDLLMGVDSEPRTVLNLSRGTGMLYNVHQNKGMDYVVNGQHILCLKKSIGCDGTGTRKRRYPEDEEYTEISVLDYLEKSNRWKRNFLGYRTGVEFQHNDVDIEPYFLGAWLGDGTSTNLALTTEDPEMVQFLVDYSRRIGQELVVVCKRGNAMTYRINGVRGRGYRGKGHLLEKFQKLNLLSNKHIPDSFLYNSSSIRKQVLAGLIDTDGSLQGNCYDITLKNELLANQTAYLAHSLGLRCSILKCNKTCTNNGKVGVYYRLNISGNTQIIPTKIERKKIKSYNKSVSPVCTGITVTETGIGEYYGFETDGDHKFLLEDFTVTHNSHFIAQKLALQMTTMDGRNLVVLRKQAVDCRESAYPNLYNAICDLGLRKFWHIVEHPTMRMVNLVNGNTIIFDGVDDIENIKSIKFKKKPDEELELGEENLIEGNLTDVWYEEASEEESISPIEELDRRLRDRTKQCRIILSFNPVFVEHWLKGFIDRLEKSRRKNYIVMKSTYKDNKFLPRDYIQMLEDYRLTNPYAYQVYALGNWGVMGDSIFDANQVNKRLEELYTQEDRLARTVDFAFELREDNRPITDSIAPYDDLYGQTIIYEAPQKGVPYVLAVDTAGDSRLDYYAGQVINNITGNQAAVFHSQNIPHWCVHQVYCLAVYYNFALIAPEINFDRFILEKLKEFEYPYVYQRNKPMDSLNYGYEAKMGFITSAENRPRILNALVLYISKNVNTVNDIDTLHEFLTFTRQVKKRTNGMWMGAANGAHDDLVMSYAIALEARQQQSTEKIPDRRVITGMYFPEQLKSMVRHGELDEDAARDYLKKNKEFFYNLIGDVDEYDFYD